MRRYAVFITEDEERVEIDFDCEVINHITGEILPAVKAPPDEAVLLRAHMGLFDRDKLAMRDALEFKRSRRRFL